MKTKQKFKDKLFLIVIPVFIIFAFWAGLYPRTDVQGTTQLLKEQNYKPINVGGHAWFTGKKVGPQLNLKLFHLKVIPLLVIVRLNCLGKAAYFLIK